MTTVPVKEAAKRLGVDDMTLRVMIQQKLIPIGVYVKKPLKGRGKYVIWEEKLNAYIEGKETQNGTS